MQANSAGLTLNLLNLAYMSARWLMSETDSEDITSYSVMVNREGFSKGKHHWMAHKMNNSDHDSSNSVTCKSVRV